MGGLRRLEHAHMERLSKRQEEKDEDLRYLLAKNTKSLLLIAACNFALLSAV